MTGLTLTAMICLGVVDLISLSGLMILVWWTLDSRGQHSIGAQNQLRQAGDLANQMAKGAQEIVRIQTELTETLLLGRKSPGIEPLPESVSPNETSVTPDDLWNGLPENILEAVMRDREEAATWPSPSETLQNPSANGQGNLWAESDEDPSSLPTP